VREIIRDKEELPDRKDTKRKWLCTLYLFCLEALLHPCFFLPLFARDLEAESFERVPILVLGSLIGPGNVSGTNHQLLPSLRPQHTIQQKQVSVCFCDTDSWNALGMLKCCLCYIPQIVIFSTPNVRLLALSISLDITIYIVSYSIDI